MQILLGLLLLGITGVLLGVGLIVWTPLKRRLEAEQRAEEAKLGAPGVFETTSAPRRPKKKPARDHEAWLEGRDLQAYPERLAALEDTLQVAHRAAQDQLQHLSMKEAELSLKAGREELTRRYRQDLDALQRRAGAIRRVMATVWKTRAILLLRVHLALAARRRPDLSGLPAPAQVKAEGLDAASNAYGAAAKEVRAFVAELEERARSLDGVAPSAPLSAEPSDEDRAAVEAERAEITETFIALRERMDALADTLTYLADRMRTQHVVEGVGLSMDVSPEAGRLLDEVTTALAQLEGLSAVGDKGLADAAVDGLTRDVSELEREGMEADAEAQASLEVERLLQQFRAGSRVGS